jgi:hypothetical protein
LRGKSCWKDFQHPTLTPYGKFGLDIFAVLLGPLQNNGGPTLTHALLAGSPAIDAGDPSFTPPPFYDQRGPGFRRVVNGRIDIGSFEVQTPTGTTRLTATP